MNVSMFGQYQKEDPNAIAFGFSFLQIHIDKDAFLLYKEGNSRSDADENNLLRGFP